MGKEDHKDSHRRSDRKSKSRHRSRSYDRSRRHHRHKSIRSSSRSKSRDRYSHDNPVECHKKDGHREIYKKEKSTRSSSDQDKVKNENEVSEKIMQTSSEAILSSGLALKAQIDKRKLLWSNKKNSSNTPTAATASTGKSWATSAAASLGSSDQANKFLKLMGVKNPDNVVSDCKSISTENHVENSSNKILGDLEKEFERSRYFQLSRGAGGKTGVGLGFQSH